MFGGGEALARGQEEHLKQTRGLLCNPTTCFRVGISRNPRHAWRGMRPCRKRPGEACSGGSAGGGVSSAWGGALGAGGIELSGDASWREADGPAMATLARRRAKGGLGGAPRPGLCNRTSAEKFCAKFFVGGLAGRRRCSSGKNGAPGVQKLEPTEISRLAQRTLACTRGSSAVTPR